MQNSLGRWFSDRQTCSLSLCSALESHSPSFTSCACSALSWRKDITKGNNTSSELLTSPPARCWLRPPMPPLPKHVEGPSKRREGANRGLSVQFAELCSTNSRGWKMKMFCFFFVLFLCETHIQQPAAEMKTRSRFFVINVHIVMVPLKNYTLLPIKKSLR